MGKQKARRKDHFHLLDHPQVWRVPVNGERLLIVCSHRYGGKYCGLAEMSGPFDPETEVNIWTEGLQGNEGVIPTRWIVAKDVEFPFFDDSCLGCTHDFLPRVPGEAGRSLIQRYFEAEHSATAIIHPKSELAPSTPDDRARRSSQQSSSNFSKRVPRGLPPRPTVPAQPAYRSIYGQAIPAYPPYSGYAPLNNRLPPAQFPYGSVTNSRGHSTTYPMYGHGSFSYRY